MIATWETWGWEMSSVLLVLHGESVHLFFPRYPFFQSLRPPVSPLNVLSGRLVLRFVYGKGTSCFSRLSVADGMYPRCSSSWALRRPGGQLKIEFSFLKKRNRQLPKRRGFPAGRTPIVKS